VASKLAGALLFIFIIFQHFTLLKVANYELTLGAMSGFLLLAMLVRRPAYVLTTIAWSLITVLSGLAVLASGYTAGSSYLTTGLLFLLSSAIVCSAFGGIRFSIVRSTALKNSALLALSIVVCLSVLQVLMARMGSSALFNVFGSRQYFHEYNHLVGLVTFPRAQGFYLEPSYNAFVIASIGVFLLTLQWRTRRTVALVIVGIAMSQSATALILLFCFFGLAALRASVRVRFIAIISAALLLSVSGAYLLLRLGTITTEGSSAYYRLLAPLNVLTDVLTYSPVGRPFGSVEETISDYKLHMAGVPASSLDNGFYVVVFYFGWFGLAAIGALGIGVARVILSGGRAVGRRWIAFVWLFSSFAFSGAIMTPEFGLTTAIVILAVRLNRMDDDCGIQSTADTFDRNGNLRRPSGLRADPRIDTRSYRRVPGGARSSGH
jgi:putative colanic acid polymerase